MTAPGTSPYDMASLGWTDERVELLTTMWADGYKASQIATELGGVTRNAVLGKINRLKLTAPKEKRVDPKPAPNPNLR